MPTDGNSRDQVCEDGRRRPRAERQRLVFEDRGERELKGVPDRWRLYAATG
jgi:hypothetical protein